MKPALVRTLLLVVLATAALEAWRPLFYLTDDNLTGYLPVVTDWCRRLWHGSWAFEVRDPSVLTVFSPWLFLFSWLALTPAWFALVDVVSLCNSLAIAAAFCWSALWLRQHFKLDAPDWLIVLLSVSYTFTPFNLLIGSSWLGFYNAEASFPLIVVGFFHPSARKAVALSAAALCYALLGGHAHTFIVLCLFAGLASLIVAVFERSVRPALRLVLAGALAGLLMSPILLPAVRGFSVSPRAQGVAVAAASMSSLDFDELVLSYLIGPASRAFSSGISMHGADRVYNLSIAFSLANVLLLLILARLRKLDALLAALLVSFVAAALLVMRPPWLGHAIARAPLLRSLQWPFREIWVLHFAAHTAGLLTFRSTLTRTSRWAALSIGSLLFAAVFVVNRAPTLYLFELDRRLIVTGVAERYWAGLAQELAQPLIVVSGIEPAHRYSDREKIPFALLGTFNYGSLYGYEPRQGYTFTKTVGPEDPSKPRPYDFSGAYTLAQARRLARENPALTHVELWQVNPPEWSVAARGRLRRYRYVPETEEVVPLGPWIDFHPAKQ